MLADRLLYLFSGLFNVNFCRLHAHCYDWVGFRILNWIMYWIFKNQGQSGPFNGFKIEFFLIIIYNILIGKMNINSCIVAQMLFNQ